MLGCLVMNKNPAVLLLHGWHAGRLCGLHSNAVHIFRARLPTPFFTCIYINA